MLKKITMVMLAAGALAFDARAASADGHLSGRCYFESVRHEQVTGDTFHGVLVGYGVNSSGGPVTVHCEVRDGNAPPSASTPPGSGTGVAVTAGPVSFRVSDSDTIFVCAVVTDGSETAEFCRLAILTQFPPPPARGSRSTRCCGRSGT